MANTTIISRPPSSSPVSSIQGWVAYGDGNPATTTTLTYHFGTRAGTQAWSPEYKAEFRAALSAIEAVANIKFVESASSSADLVEYIAPSSFFDNPRTLGYHYTPSSGPSRGAYNTAYWTANSGPGGNGDPGGYFFTTLIHELGHALGLGHPHDTGLLTTVMNGVTSPFNSFGTGNLNQGVYTVMSYNDGWTSQNGILSVNATYGGSTGLGALDIAALQAMYGANTTYNSGNNVYTLPSANVAGTGYQALWDTGGNDTIQHVGSSNSWIDLRAATLDYSASGGGAVAAVSGVKGGFTIAHGVVIENATGGSGDDLLIGNTAQNILRGNHGNDTIHSLSNGTNNNTIYGGHGNDTIHVANGSGADQIFGNQGNDLAIVTYNGGSFSGGSENDTVRFVSAISNYLFFKNGTMYEFLNVVARVKFTIANDVELIQFLNGSQQYTQGNIEGAMQLSDIDTTGTTLKHASQGVYVVDAGGTNAALVYNGQGIGQNSLSGWQALQAQASGGGYKVLWKNIDGSYSEWTTNANGHFLSSSNVGNVVDRENFYGADLNNDGHIGHRTTSVESNGSTSLSLSTQDGYKINGSIQLSYNGANARSDSFLGWQAIQAEASGSGYKVLWKHSNGSYSEWTTNANGQFLSSSNVGNVVDVEDFYGVDLNNDGRTGHFTTSIESNGSTTLGSSTHGVYVLDGSINLVVNGTNVGPNSFAGWQAVQAEAVGSGNYRLLWQHTDGRFGEWVWNSTTKTYSSSIIENVVDVETAYNVDLNSDGQIGHVTTVIENNGSTSLSLSTQDGYKINGTIQLSFNGANARSDSFPGWQAIHAEASGSGFRVLWRHTDGSYSEWTTDGTGKFQSSVRIPDVIDVEDFYSYDIDGSGTVGRAEPKLANRLATDQSTAKTENVYESPDWIETVDQLEFIPDLGAQVDAEDDYALVSLLDAQDPVDPASENPEGTVLNEKPDSEDEESDSAPAFLWEEDGFLI